MTVGDVHLIDLAPRALGGSVLVANDETYAEKENLIKVAEPTFAPATMGPRGQVYDGWETRRRRDVGGSDWPRRGPVHRAHRRPGARRADPRRRPGPAAAVGRAEQRRPRGGRDGVVDLLPPRDAARQVRSCCASPAWAAALADDPALRAAPAEGNRAHEERFGHVYPVRAAGRSGAEMLALLRERLGNDGAAERDAVRRQLAEITSLRLGRLWGEGET